MGVFVNALRVGRLACALAAGAVLIGWSVGVAHAQGRSVTGLIGGDSLVLYSDSAGKNRVRSLSKSEIPFPMALVDEEGNFGRVAADGGHYWIELPKVRIRQGAAIACTPGLSQKREPVQTAGSRASNDACRR